MPLKTSHHLFLFVLFAICAVIADAQYAPKPDPVFETIQAIDTRLVEVYNQCDPSTLASKVAASLSSDDHDQASQPDQAVDQVPSVDVIEQNITATLERVLQPKVLTICPMKDMVQ